MTNSEKIYTAQKIYTALCIIFTSFIILGNVIYQKFVILQIPFYRFELSAGAILYPLTFLITDLIVELYGKEKATFCIRFAMVMNIFAAITIVFMDHLPSTAWSKLNDATFHEAFAHYGVAFIGSTIACYIAQAIDVYLYLSIGKLTKGRYLWLRSSVSTGISLFIDTAIVIMFVAIFGVLPIEQIWQLILHSYSWKLLVTICGTPLLYLSIAFIKHKNVIFPLE